MASVTSLGFNLFSTYNGRGVSRARRDLQRLGQTLVRINTVNQAIGQISMQTLMGTAVMAAPALITLGQAAGSAAGSFLAMATTAGSAGGIFAGVMGAAIGRAKSLADSEKDLNEAQQNLIDSTNGFRRAWNQMLDDTSNLTLPAATTAINAARDSLSQLPRLLEAVSPVAERVAESFRSWVNRDDGLPRFIDLLVSEGVPALDALVNASRSFLGFLGEGLRDFAPLGTQMAESMERGARAMKDWAEEGGFRRFIQRVQDNAPEVREFMRALGDALSNVFQALKDMAPFALEFATVFLRAIADMPVGVIQAMIYAFVAWRAATLALVGAQALGMLIKFIPMIVTGVKTLRAALMGATVAQWAMNVAMLANPVVAVTVAVAALVAGLAWLGTQVGLFSSIWEGMLYVFLQIIPGVGQVLLVLRMFGVDLGDIWNWIKSYVLNPMKTFFTQTIPDAARFMKEYIAGQWDNLVQLVRGAWNLWKSIIFNPMMTFFTEIIPGAVGRMRDTVVTQFNNARDRLGAIWTAIKRGVLNPVKNFFTQTIPQAAGAARSGIVDAFDRVLGFFRGLPGKIASATSGMFNGMTRAFKSAVNTIIRGWNRLSFKIGGGSYDPLGKFGPTISVPSFTFNTPNIPQLANGGNITRRGATMVGEEGPEILSLPRGAQVSPLAHGAIEQTSLDVGGEGVSLVINGNVFTKSPAEFEDMVVQALREAQRKKRVR